MVSSPGVFTEIIHLFMARGLTHTDSNPEAHEVLEVHWIPLAEALAWSCSGEIVDAKSLVALFRASEYLDHQGTLQG